MVDISAPTVNRDVTCEAKFFEDFDSDGQATISKTSIQVLYSTPDHLKSGSACHMTRSTNHRRYYLN